MWSRLLEYRGVYVIAEVAVVHDRPVGNGRSRTDRRRAMKEMRALHRSYGACEMRKSVGGYDGSGGQLDERSERFLPTYLEGYAWLTDRKPRVRARLLRDQADDPATWLRESRR